MKKGQVGMGLVLVAFVAIIVALALYTGALPFIGTATNTQVLVNQTFTSPAASGSTVDLVGQELLDTPIVTNATGALLIEDANYTIAEAVSAVDGLKRITYTADTAEFNDQELNVSYSYGAEGYIDNSGGRSIATLIAIFAALAVAVIALVPTLRGMNVFR